MYTCIQSMYTHIQAFVLMQVCVCVCVCVRMPQTKRSVADESAVLESAKRMKIDTSKSFEEIDKSLSYLSGFGCEHQSEALPGALPQGLNSPQVYDTHTLCQ